MGKGDKKSRRGKITIGTYGRRRKKKKVIRKLKRLKTVKLKEKKAANPTT